MTNVFVGNLDFHTTGVELRAAFAAYGTVQTVTIVMDGDPYNSLILKSRSATSLRNSEMHGNFTVSGQVN